MLAVSLIFGGELPPLVTVDAAPAPATSDRGSVTGRVQNTVTGQYLNNARVSVKGTELTAFTDQFGTYRLVNVVSGPIVLQVFYTDLNVSETTLHVPAGGAVEHDVGLTSVARYGSTPGIVKLDRIVVFSDKETDAHAIAINEQRFAPNIKNVMSADSLGNVVGGSVGEFMKFIPGLTAEYGQETIFEISVRGIGGGMTSFTADGAPMVSVNMFFGGGRTFNVDSLSLNDISRVDVTKVPVPSSAADSLAGSINMISKSAFERSRAELRVGVSLTANSENLSTVRVPFSNKDKKAYAIRPSFDFDYTLPIGKNFGIVLTGMQSNRFHEQHLSTTTFSTAGAGTGGTISRPYLSSYRVQDGPVSKTRNTLSLKADWRATPHSVLSFGANWNRFSNVIGTLNWTITTGTNGTPTPAAGIPMTYGEDFTNGATGRGSVTMNPTSQTIEGGTVLTNLNYRFNDGRWKIESGVSNSTSDWIRDNTGAGHFNSLNAVMTVPVRTVFSKGSPDRPGAIQIFDNSNREVDIYNIANYYVANANDTPYHSDAGVRSGNLNVRRGLEAFAFPAAVQIGGSHRIQTLDVRTETRTWTHNGPDGNPLTDENPSAYLMQVYKNQDSFYGFKNIPWLSPRHALTAYRQNPVLFSQTPAQIVAQETTRITNSEYIKESASALYVQAEARFFSSRLKLLTGVRFEKTTGEGQGALNDPNAVFQRNAAGAFLRNAQGQRIRKPEAGLVGSMEELRLILKERAAFSNRSYDGYYPSLHLTYDVKENFLARAAYARTYGRPAFADVIPRTVISERDLTEQEAADPTVVHGSLTVRNSNLRPWTADNYDLSFEYYTQQGGLFSAGVFLKEIKNFFGTATRFATLADLQEVGIDDPRYVGWNLSTKFNAGDARITGAEFNVRHSLRAVGKWGQHFTVFANATKLKLEGNQQANFQSFIPTSGNWGASFSRKQISLVARWNYRGLDKRTAQPAFGPDAFSYFKARTTLDLSLAWHFTQRLSLQASVNNVFNVPQTTLYYGSATPKYAQQFRTEEFGVPITIGIRGTF